MNYYLAGMHALTEAGAVQELVQLLGNLFSRIRDIDLIWFLSYILESVIVLDVGSAALLATRMVEKGGSKRIFALLKNPNPNPEVLFALQSGTLRNSWIGPIPSCIGVVRSRFLIPFLRIANDVRCACADPIAPIPVHRTLQFRGSVFWLDHTW